MPTISELSETKDVIVTIDLKEIETEQLLIGKNIKKGFFISSVINEIMKEASIPKDVAEIIALYGVDTSLEDWVSLTTWLPQHCKSKMILSRICLLLAVVEVSQMVLAYLSHAKYTPALYWTRFVMVPCSSEINAGMFLLSFMFLYSQENTKIGRRCCGLWSVDKMKNLSKLPLEQINKKEIDDFVRWAKSYLSSSILETKLVTPLFVLAILSGLTSLVISFFSNNSPKDGIEISVKTIAAVGIALASLGLYKNCQIKNRALRDESILTAESPDFSKLN